MFLAHANLQHLMNTFPFTTHTVPYHSAVMARKSTVRPDTQDTAAYAASQPLFDTFRRAIDALEEQKNDLTTARDTTQRLHVKLANGNVENNGLSHENYVDAVVKAWTSATESYVKVFEQLCAIAAPDPSTGKDATAGYEGFKSLLDTAQRARDVAVGYVSKVKSPSRSPAPVKVEADTTEPLSKRARTRRKSSLDVAKIETPTSTKRAAPTDPDLAHDSPRPSKKQRTVPIPSSPNQPTIPTNLKKSAPHPVAPPPIAPKPPAVQYADLSADVKARLEEKEAARRAKKEAKKRKRESQGSNIIEAEAGAEQAAMVAHEKRLAEMPAKKKSKRGPEEAVKGDDEKVEKQSSKLQKRRGGGGEAEGGKKKKRKRF
jgi:hypothetical protein